METIYAYITKDYTGFVELWKKEPAFDKNDQIWYGPNGEISDEITDDFLDGAINDLVKKNECIQIGISKVKSVYDYNETPEGKIMKAIFD